MEKPPFPRELSEKLERLTYHEAWPGFVDLANQMIAHWRGFLSKFSIDDSCEKIAKDRIKFTAMIQGVESLFFQMNELVHELKNRKDKHDD